VRAYNTELRTIPGRWIASIVYPDAKVMETFTATAGSERPPQVKF
jgi:LemA protein